MFNVYAKERLEAKTTEVRDEASKDKRWRKKHMSERDGLA
jgi:hypothetical protein